MMLENGWLGCTLERSLFMGNGKRGNRHLQRENCEYGESNFRLAPFLLLCIAHGEMGTRARPESQRELSRPQSSGLKRRSTTCPSRPEVRTKGFKEKSSKSLSAGQGPADLEKKK